MSITDEELERIPYDLTSGSDRAKMDAGFVLMAEVKRLREGLDRVRAARAAYRDAGGMADQVQAMEDVLCMFGEFDAQFRE